MKRIWVRVIPWEKKKVTTALEGGAHAVVVEEGRYDDVKALGRIQVVAPDGDLVPGEDVEFFEVASGEDEDAIVAASRERLVVVSTTDWTVIPLENLVSRTDKVLAVVHDPDSVRVALTVLEKGVAGVMIDAPDIPALKGALAAAGDVGESTPLEKARVVEVKSLGMGDRVCVDTCSMMTESQGLLVGNSSMGMFLVHAETLVNPYVSPRPFRVNAGPIHLYVRVPGGKTRYLSEVEAGDEVMIYSYEGLGRPAVVGRVKVEKRPLVMVAAEAQGKKFTVVLQNAETVRLTSPDGSALSVASIATGDEVLVAVETGARHFGRKVEEFIIEK